MSDAVHSAKPNTQEVIWEYTRCHAYKLRYREVPNPQPPIWQRFLAVSPDRFQITSSKKASKLINIINLEEPTLTSTFLLQTIYPEIILLRI